MATLTELHDLFQDATLVKKVRAALIISIYGILQGTPTAADRAYAAKVFASPERESERLLKYVLAANSTETVTNIIGASDVTVQQNVDAAVLIMVQADAGT